MLLAAKPESAHDARDDLSTGVKGLNKRDYSFLSLYILYIPTLSHSMIKQFKHLKEETLKSSIPRVGLTLWAESTKMP